MSVLSSQSFIITSSNKKIHSTIQSLIKSGLSFEVLNPKELGKDWEQVHFLSSEKDYSESLDLLAKAMKPYQPKGLFAGLLDNRIQITSEDLAAVEKSSTYVLELSEKLVEYFDVKEALQNKPTATEYDSEIARLEGLLVQKGFTPSTINEDQILSLNIEEKEEILVILHEYVNAKQAKQNVLSGKFFSQKLKELKEYFKLREVDPNNPSTQVKKHIAALHALFENKQKTEALLPSAFTTEPDSETVFLFIAVPENQASIVENLLEAESETFEKTDWNQEIVTWKQKEGLKAFQSVAQSLGTIGSQEIDPSPVIAIAWMTFFAFAFGDALYALIIALVTGYLYFFKKVKPGIKNFLFLFFISSVATVLFGILTNSWASDFANSGFVKTLLGVQEGNTFIYDLLANAQILDLGVTGDVNNGLPLNEILQNIGIEPVVFLLGFTGLIGFLVLLTGYLLKSLNALKQNNLAAFLEYINWFLFALTIPVAVVGLTTSAAWLPVALIVLVALLLGFFVFNPGKSIVAKIIAGFGKMYGLVSFGADVISFTRLAAVGMTATIIGFVVNVLASLIMGQEFNIIGFILGIAVLIIGHGLNLVLALFAAYINPLRLHYVEFMPTFFEGKARPLKNSNTESTFAEIQN